MKQFLPYELAFLFKEKGFDEDCMAYWSSNDIWGNTLPSPELCLEGDATNEIIGVMSGEYPKAPTYDQAIDYLLSKGISVQWDAIPYMPFDNFSVYILMFEEDMWFPHYKEDGFKDRYTALQAGFKHALNLI